MGKSPENLLEFHCYICGHKFKREKAPRDCPKCYSPRYSFQETDNIVNAPYKYLQKVAHDHIKEYIKDRKIISMKFLDNVISQKIPDWSQIGVKTRMIAISNEIKAIDPEFIREKKVDGSLKAMFYRH